MKLKNDIAFGSSIVSVAVAIGIIIYMFVDKQRVKN